MAEKEEGEDKRKCVFKEERGNLKRKEENGISSIFQFLIKNNFVKGKWFVSLCFLSPKTKQG